MPKSPSSLAAKETPLSSTEEIWSLRELLDAPVRIHTKLARLPEAKLWYYARACDTQGRGVVTVYFQECMGLLKCSKSTLFRYLKRGKERGFFRRYRKQGHLLHLWLGGLSKVSQAADLDDWGAVATVTLAEIKDCRFLATEITAEKLQQESRYAARLNAKGQEERIDDPLAPKRCDHPKVYQAEQLLASKGLQPSVSRGLGGTNISYILGVSDSVIYASEGLIPFGASQASIGARLQISERSVRRHLARLRVRRKQLCQRVDKRKEHIPDEEVRTAREELSGQSTASKRFFKGWGRWWLRRCNLYHTPLFLCTMRHRRKEYRKIRFPYREIGERRGDDENKLLLLDSIRSKEYKLSYLSEK